MAVSRSVRASAEEVLRKPWWLFLVARLLSQSRCQCRFFCDRRRFLVMSYMLQPGHFAPCSELAGIARVVPEQPLRLANGRQYLGDFNASCWLFRDLAPRLVSLMLCAPLATQRTYFAMVLTDTEDAWAVMAWNATGLGNLVSPYTLACSFSAGRPTSINSESGFAPLFLTDSHRLGSFVRVGGGVQAKTASNSASSLNFKVAVGFAEVSVRSVGRPWRCNRRGGDTGGAVWSHSNCCQTGLFSMSMRRREPPWPWTCLASGSSICTF